MPRIRSQILQERSGGERDLRSATGGDSGNHGTQQRRAFFVCVCVCVCVFFLGLHPRHMEGPRPGVESEL